MNKYNKGLHPAWAIVYFGGALLTVLAINAALIYGLVLLVKYAWNG